MGVTSSMPSLADTFSPDQAVSSLLIALLLLVWKLVWGRLLRAGQTLRRAARNTLGVREAGSRTCEREHSLCSEGSEYCFSF